MTSPRCTGPEGLMSVTVPGVDGSATWLPLTCSPIPINWERTSLYCRPKYDSGTRLIAGGVDTVGVAELTVGVGVGVEDVGAAVVDAGFDVVAVEDGNRLPACETTMPTRAKSTSRIRAISGQVHGLRPRRLGSSSGS